MICENMDNTPHQSALRKGRVSIPGKWYSITSCIEGKRPLLIPDPINSHKETRPAQIIKDCIRWLHEQGRLVCKGYVIMPDHIHIILELGEGQTLSGVMSSFGKFTSKQLNELTGNKGRVWQHGFYDHCLRDEKTYLRYMFENPVRKGFVQDPEDWPFSEILPNWYAPSPDGDNRKRYAPSPDGDK